MRAVIVKDVFEEQYGFGYLKEEYETIPPKALGILQKWVTEDNCISVFVSHNTGCLICTSERLEDDVRESVLNYNSVVDVYEYLSIYGFYTTTM
ncbi:hypothetical protein [Bacillus phage Nachito]|nr:hypothetical protein [Bacillus phage Nachito]